MFYLLAVPAVLIAGGMAYGIYWAIEKIKEHIAVKKAKKRLGPDDALVILLEDTDQSDRALLSSYLKFEESGEALANDSEKMIDEIYHQKKSELQNKMKDEKTLFTTYTRMKKDKEFTYAAKLWYEHSAKRDLKRLNSAYTIVKSLKLLSTEIPITEEEKINRQRLSAAKHATKNDKRPFGFSVMQFFRSISRKRKITIYQPSAMAKERLFRG
ncbi:MAG: hypothetical protein SFW07_05715 [Gammaproteobacteria bacterium]|nr:hypothetical protein [Gammaproteobacteria bacterium]